MRKLFRDVKIKYLLSGVIFAGALVVLFISLTAEGAPPDVQPPEVITPGPAQKQDRKIYVGAVGKARPSMIWTQLDDRSFRAQATGGPVVYLPYTTSRGLDHPSGQMRYTITLNFSQYAPSSVFKDSDYNQVTLSDIEQYGDYWLLDGYVTFDRTINTYQGVGEPVVNANDKKSSTFEISTGGPEWTDNDPMWQSDGQTPANIYGTNQQKRIVKYDAAINLVWRGYTTESKEIKLEAPSTMKVGDTDRASSYVRSTKYLAYDWQNMISDPFAKMVSDNSAVVSVTPQGSLQANGEGTAVITATWKNDAQGYYLMAKKTITVTKDTPPNPGGGTGGGGGIMFTPNDSSAMEPPYVRGWARRDFPVTASVVGYQPFVTEINVVGSRQVSYSCGTVDKPETCYRTETTTIPYKATWEADIGNIQITGDASGTNTVTMSKEGDNLKLHGKVEFTKFTEVWNPGIWTATKPTAPPKPAPIEGDSGIYKLDKQKPVQTVQPTSQYWTNIPIQINIRHTDNLSGFNDTGYQLTNISYYGTGNLSDNAPQYGKSWNPILTISQQGVYTLKTRLGDYAGWPEVGATGSQEYMFIDYRYDSIPPYSTQYALGTGGVSKNGTFDYITDASNTVRVSVGDELSGVIRTEFSWSKSPDRSRPNVNGYGAGWNDIPLTTPDYASGPNQFSGYVDININSKTQYNQYQAYSYDDEKDGTWYLHIRQTDRAGNMTHSVSPPIFVNKVKNLRVFKISDFAWKNYFLTAANVPTLLTIDGIQTNDMPIYYNKAHRNVSLGYGADYKFDSIGFDGPNDRIEIKMHYHGLDQNGGLYKYDDVYVETKSGDFIKLKDSEYAAQGDLVTFSHTINSDKKLLYEDGIAPNVGVRGLWLEDTAKSNFSTWKHRVFLPPTTKFVKSGQPLDLINGRNQVKYKELVTFTIKAYREGHSQPLQYTLKEDSWATTNMWGGTAYNSYGKNRPTGTNVLGLGTNKGEVIWFDLQKTLKDDLKYFREW